MRRSSSRHRGSRLPERSIAPPVVQNRFQEAEMMDQAQTSAYTYADILRESLVSMMVNNGEVDTTFLEKVRSIQQFDSLRILTNNTLVLIPSAEFLLMAASFKWKRWSFIKVI